MIAEILGFLGGTIGILQGVPQALRIRRLGHADGVSLSHWYFMTTQFAAWVGFGLRVESPAIWVTNALTFATSAAVIFGIQSNKLKAGAYSLLLATAAATFCWFGPGLLVDWFLIAMVASRLPQLIRTFRNRKTADPTAVSISSLAISLASMAFWFAYAIINANTLVIITTIIAVSITLATAILERQIIKSAQ
ncbi:MAG: hypothetical protein RL723_659 [Actinomycetota bacterium]